MSFFEKIKEETSKKTLENSVIFLILFIIVIIVINSVFSENKDVTTNAPLENVQETFAKTSDSNDLEEKLENIISMIEGAGKARVMISYLNGVEQIPMYDEKISTTIIKENDRDGGVRTTEQTSNEHNIIFDEKSNNKSVVIKKVVMPEIIGVIVVADGANNLKVKENIIKAIEATVNVPSHRIQVFSSGK